jgi:hypothetical protein
MKRPLLAALAALPMLPASASGATQWFYNRAPIAGGETVEVPAAGSNLARALERPRSGQTTVKIACPASGTQAFRNSPTNGLDETRTISFSCRAGTTVTPILPWTSTLLESALPLHDRWENVALSLTYNGANLGTFAGSLDTTVGDIDPQRDKEHQSRDEPDSYLVFRGGSKKALLTGPNRAKLWFSGALHLGGRGSRVTDENGEWLTSPAPAPALGARSRLTVSDVEYAA